MKKKLGVSCENHHLELFIAISKKWIVTYFLHPRHRQSHLDIGETVCHQIIGRKS